MFEGNSTKYFAVVEFAAVEVVADSFDPLEFNGCGDGGGGGAELFRRTEIVASPADEEGGGAELGEVGRPELIGLGWRMKGVAEENEGVRDGRIFGCEHAELAASVGMASGVNRAGDGGAEFDENFAKAFAVGGGGGGVGRASGFALAEGQVVANDRSSSLAAGVCKGNQQR